MPTSVTAAGPDGFGGGFEDDEPDVPPHAAAAEREKRERTAQFRTRSILFVSRRI
jgi:hypothetical protein